MEEENAKTDRVKLVKQSKSVGKRIGLFILISISLITGILLFNNRGGNFVVEICDETGNNCFSKEARVDPEWSSTKLVTVRSKSVWHDQRDKDIVITYSCQEFGKLGACTQTNSGFTYSIRKIQRQ